MKTSSLAVLSSTMFLAVCGGCAGGSGLFGASLTNSSRALEAPPFNPPHDPAMGQIVLTVPEVHVSAAGAHGLSGLGQSVHTQLAAALSSSPNFLVADRQSLSALADEQRLADAGATDPRDRPRKGMLAGARYLIRANVTELDEQVVGKSQGGRFSFGKLVQAIGQFTNLGIFGDVVEATNPEIGSGSETVRGLVAIDISIVDVDTGVVVGATTARAELTQDNTRSIFGIAGISTSDSEFSRSVLAQATRLAAEQGTMKVHDALRSVVLPERQAASASTPEVAMREGP